MNPFPLIILISGAFHLSFCQENAGTNVAPSLEECYNDTKLLTRDYRLPATMTTLISLIRKIEDAHPNQDARQLSFELLHRFRQDGISKTHKQVDSSLGLPYSPKRWEAYKNRVQLKKLTPGNAIQFENKSLNALEACSLHFMISSSIETQERGDESQVCNRIAHYTSRLHKREAEFAEQLDASHSYSSCPIESGVVYTKWGAVKASLLLGGIAAGFQTQQVPTPSRNGTVNSAYASTIAGELSEVALNQPSLTKTIGNQGGWNSTLVPKYYFLEKSDRDYLYLTDAEIRGALDGLYLALNIDAWTSKSSDIRISQILELYYGRGLFNTSSRACNRKNLVQGIIGDEKLVKEVTLYNELLDEESQYSYTPIKTNFPKMAKSAVDTFRTYFSSNLNDLQCSAENDVIERVSTDVLIFVDVGWNYDIIGPFLSYIIQNIDINNFGSSYTVFDGINCDKIVNKSRSILDFYEQFNRTQIQKYPIGFDYNKVLQVAENILKAKLDNQTDVEMGQSTIVLLLPHNDPSQSQSDWIATKRTDVFKHFLPDLRILVAGSGAKSAYSSFVTNQNNDVVTIPQSTDETGIKDTARSFVDRFRKIPRSVVNPNCGSSFKTDVNSFEVNHYVEPNGVNYHKVSPNYFYEGQNLKIRGQGYGTLTICTSRTEANPRSNSNGAKNCQDIISDEITKDISGYCSGDSVTDCSPIYISVEGKISQNRCTDKECQFPDNMKYTIYLENVQCSSSGEVVLSSLLFISVLLAVMRF